MEQKQKSALIIFSGGQDSTFCLYWALQRYEQIHVLTFEYGQLHKIEIEAAKKIIEIATDTYPGIIQTHEIYKFGGLSELYQGLSETSNQGRNRYDIDVKAKPLQSTSPLIADTELEQYESHEQLPGGLEKTFVPMRNQMFLTIAANRAFAKGCNILVTGVCEEDSGGYPDCTRAFIDAFSKATSLGTFTAEAGFPKGIVVETPLMWIDKAETVKRMLDLPGCYYATAFSHTSYDGAYPPTGHDHATLLREKGFVKANVPDPLILRAYLEGLMKLPDTMNYWETPAFLNHCAYLKLKGIGQ